MMRMERTRMRRVHLSSPLPVLLLVVFVPMLAAASVDAEQEQKQKWPKGEVFVPTKLFQKNEKLDKIILESNPRLYVYPDFDPKADLILFIGMDGWGGRSENFIDTLRLGLKSPALTHRLVIAALQDPVTRGPKYQGQGEREHANVWSLDEPSIQVLRRFVIRIANELGHLKVYFMGYSTGSVAAPLAAARVAVAEPTDKFRVEGAISLGTGSPIRAGQLKSLNQRVLFIVVPPQRAKEAHAMRYDQGNRTNAELAYQRLQEAGAGSHAFLRHIESARRHIDWHWGLMSQCRYFRTPKRTDNGRGYWPHYWLPNPDSFELMIDFIQGKDPPEKASPHPPTVCPYDPNPGTDKDK
jgi:hypothetical protein